MEGPNPAAAGFDASRLERLDSHFRETYIAQNKLPGTITMIWRKGVLAHYSAQGWADVDRGTKMEKDSILRIYSWVSWVSVADEAGFACGGLPPGGG